MHSMCPVNQERTRSWWGGPAVNWQRLSAGGCAPSRASQAPTGIQPCRLCLPSSDAAPLQTRSRDPSAHLTRRTFLSSFPGVRLAAAPLVASWQKKHLLVTIQQIFCSLRRRFSNFWFKSRFNECYCKLSAHRVVLSLEVVRIEHLVASNCEKVYCGQRECPPSYDLIGFWSTCDVSGKESGSRK